MRAGEQLGVREFAMHNFDDLQCGVRTIRGHDNHLGGLGPGGGQHVGPRAIAKMHPLIKPLGLANTVGVMVQQGNRHALSQKWLRHQLADPTKSNLPNRWG